MTCQYCGQQVADDAPACPYCGSPTPIQQTPAVDPSAVASYPSTYPATYDPNFQQAGYQAPYDPNNYQQGYQQPGAYPGYQQVPGYPPMAYPATQPGYQPMPYGVEQKSKLAGGLLGIFLGGFGAGRFYLGYTTLGIAQLVVTLVTFGLGGLWGFIDGIMILTGSVKTDGNGYPLKD